MTVRQHAHLLTGRQQKPYHVRKRRRRAAAIVSAATLGVTAVSADAAPQAVTDATFTWGLNVLTNDGVYHGGSCFPLAAGEYSKPPVAWAPTAGNVTILKGASTAPATLGEHCTVGSPFAGPHGNPAGSINQKVQWTGGSGTVDPSTGEVDLSFAGAFSGYYYTAPAGTASGGGYTVQDLRVTVDAAGDGRIVADLSGFATDDSTPPVSTDVTQVDDVVIATFDAAGGDISSGFSATPHYGGVPYMPDAAEPAQTAGGGSWPAGFNDFQQTVGFAGWWYAWDGAADNSAKPATAFTLAFEVEGEDPPPPPPGGNTAEANGNPDQDIAVTIAEQPGIFSWEILDNNLVNLTGGTGIGDDLFAYTGALNQVEVTATRLPGTWTLSGQVGDFSDGTNTVGAQHLGWTPSADGGANSVAGSPVAPSPAEGEGLDASRVLATGDFLDTDVTGLLDAGLSLHVPGAVAAGDYTATLTLTALAT